MKFYLVQLPQQLMVCQSDLQLVYTHPQATEKTLTHSSSKLTGKGELKFCFREKKKKKKRFLLKFSYLFYVKLRIFGQSKNELSTDSFIKNEKARSILDGVSEV